MFSEGVLVSHTSTIVALVFNLMEGKKKFRVFPLDYCLCLMFCGFILYLSAIFVLFLGNVNKDLTTPS